MPTVSLLIPIFGLILCVVALAQLGLWATQSLQISFRNKKQFELAKQLLREQIRKQGDQRMSSARESVSDQAGALASSASPASSRPSSFRRLEVVKLVKETAVCTSVYMRPVDGQPCETFRAGQHLPIRFNLPGLAKPVVRCYSLSNAAGQGFYRISVKAVPAPNNQPELPAGLISNFVNHQLKVGDVVEAKPPAGDFTLQHNSEAPIVLLAGGIGITPMVSMIQEAINENVKRGVVLMYGVRNRKDQVFREWIDQQTATHENIVAVNCFSSPLEDEVEGVDYQISGYVTVDLLKQILPGPECQFYLCGPPVFMDSLSTGLASWGIGEHQIFSEAFGPAARKPRKPTASQPTDSTGAATIHFLKSNVTVNYDGQSSVLEMAEDAGVAIDSGCRAGSCETCLAKIARGQVDYPDGEPSDLGPQECLPCIAVPVGELELDL